MWLSLPAWLHWEPSDLRWLELGSTPWDSAYFLVSSATTAARSSQFAWLSCVPSDLSGFEPDGPPWVAFGHRSCGLTSLSYILQKPLIWVDLIKIVPLGLRVDFPLISSWESFVEQSPYIYILYTVWLLTEYSVSLIIFWLFSVLFFWSWKCTPGIWSHKHQISTSQ